jgi:hypothetical protein
LRKSSFSKQGDATWVGVGRERVGRERGYDGGSGSGRVGVTRVRENEREGDRERERDRERKKEREMGR